MTQHDDFVPYTANGGDWITSEAAEESLPAHYSKEFWEMLHVPAKRIYRFEMIVLDALAEHDVDNEYDASINILREMAKLNSSHAKMIASKACEDYVAYMVRAR